MTKDRKQQLDEYAEWLQADYMDSHVNCAVEVCEVLSRYKDDELTLEEANYIFENLD